MEAFTQHLVAKEFLGMVLGLETHAEKRLDF